MSRIYLINKASGGLSHMLGGIYAASIYAEKSKRFLIIDCETHIAFRHKFSDFFIIKNLEYSDDYSIIPSEYTFTAGTILNDTIYIKKIILTPTIKIWVYRLMLI